MEGEGLLENYCGGVSKMGWRMVDGGWGPCGGGVPGCEEWPCIDPQRDKNRQPSTGAQMSKPLRPERRHTLARNQQKKEEKSGYTIPQAQCLRSHTLISQANQLAQTWQTEEKTGNLTEGILP